MREPSAKMSKYSVLRKIICRPTLAVPALAEAGRARWDAADVNGQAEPVSSDRPGMYGERA
jgi:hypothetical protein